MSPTTKSGTARGVGWVLAIAALACTAVAAVVFSTGQRSSTTQSSTRITVDSLPVDPSGSSSVVFVPGGDRTPLARQLRSLSARRTGARAMPVQVFRDVARDLGPAYDLPDRFVGKGRLLLTKLGRDKLSFYAVPDTRGDACYVLVPRGEANCAAGLLHGMRSARRCRQPRRAWRCLWTRLERDRLREECARRQALASSAPGAERDVLRAASEGAATAARRAPRADGSDPHVQRRRVRSVESRADVRSIARLLAAQQARLAARAPLSAGLLGVHLEGRLPGHRGEAALDALGHPRHQYLVAEAFQLSCESCTAMIVQPSADGPAAWKSSPSGRLPSLECTAAIDASYCSSSSTLSPRAGVRNASEQGRFGSGDRWDRYRVSVHARQHGLGAAPRTRRRRDGCLARSCHRRGGRDIGVRRRSALSLWCRRQL